MENTLLFMDDFTKHAKIEELEDIKKEIYKEINKDYNLDDIYKRGINQGLYEATTIIENHIAKIKGEN